MIKCSKDKVLRQKNTPENFQSPDIQIRRLKKCDDIIDLSTKHFTEAERKGRVEE